MPYVRRLSDGSLASLHRQCEGDAVEFLPDDHPEVLSFLGQDGAEGFAALDAGFIRVLEDLIDVLIRSHVINLTDLPIEAQHKLYSRKGKRKPTALSELNLLGDANPFGGGAPFTRAD